MSVITKPALPRSIEITYKSMLMVSLSFMGTFILLIILSFYGTKLQDLIIKIPFYVLHPKYDLAGLCMFVTPDHQNRLYIAYVT